MKILKNLSFILLILPVVALADVPSEVQFDSPPDSSYATNTVVDIVPYAGGVWLATGRGINFSDDNGLSWLLFDEGSGLTSENVSALRAIGDRLWIGSSHNEIIQGQSFSLSDGVSWSDDMGQTWTQVPFDSDDYDIPLIWGGDRTVFDISGYNDPTTGRDWVFFTAFAGGMLASQDGGVGWRRIYPSVADSIQFNDFSQQPSFRNRYFACVTDTSHGDSLIMWAGTAGGVFQYVYAPDSDKLSSANVFKAGFCTGCDEPGSGYVYLGGENGLSRGAALGGQFITRGVTDGLPGPVVTAIYDYGGRLLVGTADSFEGSSTGLAVSEDFGESFSSITFTGDVSDAHVTDFALLDDRLYMAASKAGLQVSEDSGDTWAQILFDSTDADAAYNDVNAVFAFEDTLFVGTDSGLALYTFDGIGDITSRTHIPFEDGPLSGQRIVRVKVQPFENDTLPGTYDSTTIWTINREMLLSGSPMVARSYIESDERLFARFKFDTLSYDVGFIGDTALVVGEGGVEIYTGPPRLDTLDRFDVIDSLNPDLFISADTLTDTVYTINVRGDTVYIGSNHRLAISTDRGLSFAIFKGNVDSLGADVVVNHTRGNSLTIDSTTITLGLTGDFIPALGLQAMEDGPSRVWASGRSAGSGGPGIAVGFWIPVEDTLGDTTGYRIRWRALYAEDFAWNFAFDGDSVTYAATNAGVLVNRGDTSQVWDTLRFINTEGFEVLEPGTPAFGVAVVDDNLWVGTGEGTVRMNLIDDTDLELFRVVDSTTPPDEVYAFPTPFNPGRGEDCQFHFVVEQDANVTVEVYDFAMNLVARPIDDVFYPAGVYPNGNYQRLTWDGINGNGDIVAVGVYYFKVEYSTGEVRWGKLAVIP